MPNLVPPSPRHASHRPRGSAAVMRDVLLALFIRELKTRLGGRWWGLIWLVGEPLAAAALMLALYSAARAPTVAGVDRLAFLITGLLPFQLFKQLVLRSMEAIDANQALFAFRQVRPLDAVWARATLEVVLAAALAAAVALALALGEQLPWPAWPLGVLAASALLAILGTALGTLVAVATAGAWSRARSVIRMGFLPLMLASGAVVPISTMPVAVRDLLTVNPLLHVLEVLRLSYFGSSYAALSSVSLLLPAAWALGVAALSLALYRLRRDRLLAA